MSSRFSNGMSGILVFQEAGVFMLDGTVTGILIVMRLISFDAWVASAATIQSRFRCSWHLQQILSVLNISNNLDGGSLNLSGGTSRQ